MIVDILQPSTIAATALVNCWEAAENLKQQVVRPFLFGRVVTFAERSCCHFWIPLSEGKLLFVVLHLLAHDCRLTTQVIPEAYPHLADVRILIEAGKLAWFSMLLLVSGVKIQTMYVKLSKSLF